MAIDVTLTIVPLVPDVASADLVGAGASVDATETFQFKVIPASPFPPAGGGETAVTVYLEEEGTGAASVQFGGVEADGTDKTDGLAGDYPPSLQSPAGPLTVSLAQSDLKAIKLSAGRFMSSDGYIRGKVIGNDVRIYVTREPAGY